MGMAGSLVVTKVIFSAPPMQVFASTAIRMVPSPPGGIARSYRGTVLPQLGITFLIRRTDLPTFRTLKS